MHVCAEEALVALGGPSALVTLGAVQTELAAQAAALPPLPQRLYTPHFSSLPTKKRSSAAQAALLLPAPLIATTAPAVSAPAAGEEARLMIVCGRVNSKMIVRLLPPLSLNHSYCSN